MCVSYECIFKHIRKWGKMETPTTVLVIIAEDTIPNNKDVSTSLSPTVLHSAQ